MYNMKDRLDMGVAMSPTFDSIKMFKQFLPLLAIYLGFDQDKIDAILDHQQERDLQEKPVHNVFIILDDCMFDKKILNGKTMRKLHMNGRHINLFFVNLMQYVMDYPASLRGQIDYVFALWEPSLENRMKLWKTFFGIFPTFEEFNYCFRKITKNRRAMVADFTSEGTDITDVIHYYLASPNLPKFCCGSRDFWKLNHKALKEELAKRNVRNREEDDEAASSSAPKRGRTGKAVSSMPKISLEGLP
jgi:hypothetical protein